MVSENVNVLLYNVGSRIFVGKLFNVIDFVVNETKTEQYQIPRPHPDPLLLDPNSALDQNDVRWSALNWITINAKQITPVNIKEPDWKKCKLLGSLLDTSDDITRRKMIALEHMTTFKTSLIPTN